MYLASRGRLSYTLSIERVVGEQYTKHSLFVLKIFAIFRLCHAHMRKDTRLSLLFHTASDEKLGGAWEPVWAFSLKASDCVATILGWQLFEGGNYSRVASD